MTHTNTPASTKQLRSFGLLMATVFAVIGIWPLLFHGLGVRMWAAGIAGTFLVVGLIFPQGLQPLYRGWMYFAEKLGWFNTRVLLGLVFFIILTPIALLVKIFGKRPIQDTFDQRAESYRIPKSLRSVDHLTKAILGTKGGVDDRIFW